ncbi:hypothetical protein HELRODRAFT_182012 [Helobdella robusta]|uniref:Uncharacterized protein n=1 Tax=Helobdella robusta TaxID=6412 RepID=T1FHL4_HELRO|nr:hypothetical protein HELRODRAFT_182012 [Helobdella robusta]ESN91838.1 hypothetical protein HELRODRAFT_182012 [Helobdella robusta]
MEGIDESDRKLLLPKASQLKSMISRNVTGIASRKYSNVEKKCIRENDLPSCSDDITFIIFDNNLNINNNNINNLNNYNINNIINNNNNLNITSATTNNSTKHTHTHYLISMSSCL